MLELCKSALDIAGLYYCYLTLQSSRSQWQIVFIISASAFFVGNLVYIIWGSNHLQPWDAVDFLKKRYAELIGDNPAFQKDNAGIKKNIQKIT